MSRSERRHLTGSFAFLMAWLVAMAMGAAAESRASYDECIKAGESTLYCSQGYEPYQSIKEHS